MLSRLERRGGFTFLCIALGLVAYGLYQAGKMMGVWG